MPQTLKNPEEGATSFRAMNCVCIGDFVCVNDFQDSKSSPLNKAPWPVKLLARRHGLSAAHASLVLALSGLGGGLHEAL